MFLFRFTLDNYNPGLWKRQLHWGSCTVVNQVKVVWNTHKMGAASSDKWLPAHMFIILKKPVLAVANHPPYSIPPIWQPLQPQSRSILLMKQHFFVPDCFDDTFVSASKKLSLSKSWFTVQCECISLEIMQLVLQNKEFRACLVLLL